MGHLWRWHICWGDMSVGGGTSVESRMHVFVVFFWCEVSRRTVCLSRRHPSFNQNPGSAPDSMSSFLLEALPKKHHTSEVAISFVRPHQSDVFFLSALSFFWMIGEILKGRKDSSVGVNVSHCSSSQPISKSRTIRTKIQ